MNTKIKSGHIIKLCGLHFWQTWSTGSSSAANFQFETTYIPSYEKTCDFFNKWVERLKIQIILYLVFKESWWQNRKHSILTFLFTRLQIACFSCLRHITGQNRRNSNCIQSGYTVCSLICKIWRTVNKVLLDVVSVSAIRRKQFLSHSLFMASKNTRVITCII